jgi:hypothetical protein
MLFQADSCAVSTEGAATKKCLNDKKCLPSTTGGSAFCGTGTEIFCPLDGAQCNCAQAMPPILGCNTKGAASGPEETTLSEFDGCGVLKTEVATTCLIGERCWYTWLPDGSVDERAGAHCASSMGPSQRSSPFYAMACDEEIYMRATTGLFMDCRCNRSNAAMQACRPGSDAWGMGLRLGTGPHMHGINFAKWGGGFIHNGELFAPVHYTGGNAGGLKPGGDLRHQHQHRRSSRRVGVVQISSDGTSCTHVSRWASHNLTTPQYGTINGLLHRNGVIYANTKAVLLAIDATTGNRSVWANAGPRARSTTTTTTALGPWRSTPPTRTFSTSSCCRG